MRWAQPANTIFGVFGGLPLNSQGNAGPLAFLGGGGDMSRAMRDHDWTRTPLGAPAFWSQSLKTLVELMLASTQPMFMAWGAEMTWLHNDAFVPILGRKHPGALGQAALDVWAEARESLAPMFERVFAGESVHRDDVELMLDRRGRLEEAHFAFSYTPARDESGVVAGLFGVCSETTERCSPNAGYWRLTSGNGSYSNRRPGSSPFCTVRRTCLNSRIAPTTGWQVTGNSWASRCARRFRSWPDRVFSKSSTASMPLASATSPIMCRSGSATWVTRRSSGSSISSMSPFRTRPDASPGSSSKVTTSRRFTSRRKACACGSAARLS